MIPKARFDLAAVAVGLTFLAVTIALSAVSHDRGELLTRNLVRLSLAWYAAALLMMMRLSPSDCLAESTLGRVTRWCWTWAIVCFLVHVGFAFHYYHRWSHAHAFETTRQTSGLGEGIYFSYTFTVLWLADALWWWLRPQSYAQRSPWLDRLLHAFMLFIVFNSVIIFETGPIRCGGIVLFTMLPAWWLLSRRVPRVRPT